MPLPSDKKRMKKAKLDFKDNDKPDFINDIKEMMARAEQATWTKSNKELNGRK